MKCCSEWKSLTWSHSVFLGAPVSSIVSGWSVYTQRYDKVALLFPCWWSITSSPLVLGLGIRHFWNLRTQPRQMTAQLNTRTSLRYKQYALQYERKDGLAVKLLVWIQKMWLQFLTLLWTPYVALDKSLRARFSRVLSPLQLQLWHSRSDFQKSSTPNMLPFKNLAIYSDA